MDTEKLLKDYIKFHHNNGNISDKEKVEMEMSAAEYLKEVEEEDNFIERLHKSCVENSGLPRRFKNDMKYANKTFTFDNLKQAFNDGGEIISGSEFGLAKKYESFEDWFLEKKIDTELKSKPIISIIAAVAKNGAIGKENKLLFRLPDDMKFFKETTNGHPVITGRLNYESIPESFRPLPNRQNIVLTRDADKTFDGAEVAISLNEAIKKAKKYNSKEIFIIGGGQIYQEAMDRNLVDRMYLTLIDAKPEADTFFPEWDESNWVRVSCERHPSDDRHKYAFDICVFDWKN